MLNLCYEQQCYCQNFKIKFVENQGTWEKCKTQTKWEWIKHAMVKIKIQQIAWRCLLRAAIMVINTTKIQMRQRERDRNSPLVLLGGFGLHQGTWWQDGWGHLCDSALSALSCFPRTLCPPGVDKKLPCLCAPPPSSTSWTWMVTCTNSQCQNIKK